ncbi:MAG: DNA repair protein RecN [Deltaproteobacteria bacterium]|nr:DNA repair protein RecN [Deltaproteobacteria bacterium]
MLLRLRIQNFVLVDSLEIELAPGMNVITGETGAGKSILLKALEMLAGERTNGSVVRRGAERSEIEAQFVLTEELRSEIIEENPNIAEILHDEDEIILRRTIDQSGRGKITANGRLVTRGEIQHLTPLLFEITGQHESHLLTQSKEHLRLLDRFGTDDTLLGEVSAAYAAYRDAKSLLDQLRSSSGEKKEYFRRVGFECEELRSAALKRGERDQLDARLEQSANAEFLTQTGSQLLDALEGEQDGVLSQLSRMRHLAEQMVRKDPRVSSVAALLENASVQLSEARFTLSDWAASVSLDPDELENLRERISEIARLERKYGREESALIDYYETIAAEVAAWESGSLDESKLEERVRATRAAFDVVATKLTAARRVSGEKLSKLVEHELSDLKMDRARFSLEIKLRDPSEAGADDLQFLFSANPGEPLRPLNQVASGGELSRVLLILKTLLRSAAGSTLQVFDEIDTGIGGAVAQLVGEKIRSLTPHSQVLLVTHAPQIASLGDRHFVIWKEQLEDTTTANIRVLAEPERVQEIARMLAGKQVSSKFEDSARELLALGRTLGNEVATPSPSKVKSSEKAPAKGLAKTTAKTPPSKAKTAAKSSAPQ